MQYLLIYWYTSIDGFVVFCQYNRVHAKGNMSVEDINPSDGPNPVDLTEICSRLRAIDIIGIPNDPVSLSMIELMACIGLYDGFSTFANYGATYQRIISCHRGLDALGREEFLVKVAGARSDLPE